MLLRRLAALPSSGLSGRAFATKAEKVMMAKKAEEKKRRRGKNIYKGAWTYAHYLKYKDPNTSYQDAESDNWELTAGMAIERTPRLQQFESFWEIEYFQFSDSLDVQKKKTLPGDWIETKKQQEESKTRVFQPNPRVTEEDRTDDRRSLHRALDKSTYLLLKLKGKGWRFPEGTWKQNETIRETAETTSLDLCGSELATHLLGNAPICHTEDAAAKKKWFLMHNIYVGGNVILDNPDVEDFAWVTKDEFHQYFKDPAFVELLHKVFYMP